MKDKLGWYNSIIKYDLDALRYNYELLKLKTAPADVAAVLKANAYGADVNYIAPILEDAGCRWFFVADWVEAFSLESILKNPQSRVAVLGGIRTSQVSLQWPERIVPVINDYKSLCILSTLKKDKIIPIILQCDTGLHRLGLNGTEIEILKKDKSILDAFDIQFYMSHCIEPDNVIPDIALKQKNTLDSLIVDLPPAPITFSNSGIFSLDINLMSDMIRAGESLYGVTAFTDRLSDLRPVISWHASILKIGAAQIGDGFGYNSKTIAARPTIYATIGVGYADGLLPEYKKPLDFYIHGFRCPVLGSISMDLTIIDVTDVPADKLSNDSMVEILGINQDLNQLSEKFGMPPHEIMVHLSRRAQRQY